MAIDVRPATDFEDVKTMVGSKRADATVCWCLSCRLTSSKENCELLGPVRGERLQLLVQEDLVWAEYPVVAADQGKRGR